jgi:hypothetical protein
MELLVVRMERGSILCNGKLHVPIDDDGGVCNRATNCDRRSCAAAVSFRGSMTPDIEEEFGVQPRVVPAGVYCIVPQRHERGFTVRGPGGKIFPSEDHGTVTVSLGVRRVYCATVGGASTWWVVGMPKFPHGKRMANEEEARRTASRASKGSRAAKSASAYA